MRDYSDKHLEERAQGALTLAAMIVGISKAIRPRQETWIRSNYSMTWEQAAASPQPLKDKMQQCWEIYWKQECKEGRGL